MPISVVTALLDRAGMIAGALERVSLLRSVPGTGPVASAMSIAEMPWLGQLSGEEAIARVGLAPIAHYSGVLRRKRAIGGGRRSLRHVTGSPRS